ncbi:MAG: DUF1311 domain-containing protein [Deltaproteobacteria bacterium]|nr:DUF1311 domain-containing protein [Deltaproteobacteria bacterium]
MRVFRISAKAKLFIAFVAVFVISIAFWLGIDWMTPTLCPATSLSYIAGTPWCSSLLWHTVVIAAVVTFGAIVCVIATQVIQRRKIWALLMMVPILTIAFGGMFQLWSRVNLVGPEGPQTIELDDCLRSVHRFLFASRYAALNGVDDAAAPQEIEAEDVRHIDTATAATVDTEVKAAPQITLEPPSRLKKNAVVDVDVCVGGYNFPLYEWNFFPACEKYRKIPIPEIDRPSDAEMVQLRASGCSSRALYYGIGTVPRPVAARKCAFMEIDTNTGDGISGEDILLMAYANGIGVTQNINVAAGIACRTAIDMGDAYISDTVEHVRVMLCKASHADSSKDEGRWDVCDKPISNWWAETCDDIQHDRRRAWRTAKIEGVVREWRDVEKDAFDNMLQTAQLFFEMSVQNELDLSGDLSGVHQGNVRALLEMDFLKSLKEFEDGKLPSFTEEQFWEQDKALNELYGYIKNNANFGLTTITFDNIKKTQRAWLKYRDEWVRFAAVRYTNVSKYSWMTLFTQKRMERLRKLKQFHCE